MLFRRHIIRSNVVTMFIVGVRLGKYTAGGVSTYMYTHGKHRVLMFRGLNKDV